MINTLIFILIVTSFISGCVVIAKKSFDEIIQKPLITQSCRPTAAKLTFYEEFRHGYTTKVYIHPRERRPQDIVWASDFINDEIIRTGYFTTGLESPKYLIEFLKRIAVSAEHKGFRVALLIKGPEPAGEYFGKEQNQLLYVLAL